MTSADLGLHGRLTIAELNFAYEGSASVSILAYELLNIKYPSGHGDGYKTYAAAAFIVAWKFLEDDDIGLDLLSKICKIDKGPLYEAMIDLLSIVDWRQPQLALHELCENDSLDPDQLKLAMCLLEMIYMVRAQPQLSADERAQLAAQLAKSIIRPKCSEISFDLGPVYNTIRCAAMRYRKYTVKYYRDIMTKLPRALI